MDRARLPYNDKISTTWEAKDDPSKTSRLLMGPEWVTRPEFLQAMMVMMMMINFLSVAV
jgi:hypothetical protein